MISDCRFQISDCKSFRNHKSKICNHKSFPSRFTIHDSRSGFTLLELIVVIFVLSLVLAISLPSFTGIGESKLKSEAKRIGSIIRYLNDSAMSTKETLRMKIAFNDKSLSYNGPDGEESERFDTLHGIELQSKGTVSEGEVIIFFGPLGAGESFKIYLKEDQSTLEVALNSMNGKVKIIQIEEERR